MKIGQEKKRHKENVNNNQENIAENVELRTL